MSNGYNRYITVKETFMKDLGFLLRNFTHVISILSQVSALWNMLKKVDESDQHTLWVLRQDTVKTKLQDIYSLKILKTIVGGLNTVSW